MSGSYRDSQRKAEQAARQVLADAGVHEPPVNVDAIARRLGADVRRRPNSPDISGLLYQKGDQVIVGVNADDSPARQRFTVAHEIGHLKLHRSGALFIDRTYRAATKSEDVPANPLQEREANWFAAELLMPEEMVREVAETLLRDRHLTDDALIGALALRFEVSRTAMGYRLLNLGFVSGL
jgi:Zn-dependent peptidase ImmA (M78 family)